MNKNGMARPLASSLYLEFLIKNERRDLQRHSIEINRKGPQERIANSKSTHSKTITYPRHFIDTTQKAITALKLSYPEKLPPPSMSLSSIESK